MLKIRAYKCICDEIVAIVVIGIRKDYYYSNKKLGQGRKIERPSEYAFRKVETVFNNNDTWPNEK